ncbi:MAG: CoA pyrophosphatase [bacterium]|nr:CoA pyrophosphatase [bacterium]
MMPDLSVARVIELLEPGLRPVAECEPATTLRPSAVLVPLLEQAGEAELLFMRRSSTMLDHAGQVSFPGGVRDSEDRDLAATALRESREEVGADPSRIRLLGGLEAVCTLRKYHIQPFLSVWPEADYEPVSCGEVASVFRVPLRWLMDPSTSGEAEVEHEGRVLRAEAWVWRGEIIWGATRRITLDLLRRLRFTI